MRRRICNNVLGIALGLMATSLLTREAGAQNAGSTEAAQPNPPFVARQAEASPTPYPYGPGTGIQGSTGSLRTSSGRNLPPRAVYVSPPGVGTHPGTGATASTGGGIGGGAPIITAPGVGAGPGASPGVGGIPGPGAPPNSIAGRLTTGGLSASAGVGAGVGGSSTGPGGMLGSGVSGSTGTWNNTGIGVNAGFGPGGSLGPTPGPGGVAITGPGAAGGTAYGGSNVLGAAAAGAAPGTPLIGAFDVQPGASTIQPGPSMGVRSGNMVFLGAGGAGAADNGGATNLPRNTPDARSAASIGLAMNALPGALVTPGGTTGGAAGTSLTPATHTVARPIDSGQANADVNARYRWFNGRWWFLMPDRGWLYYENGQWVPFAGMGGAGSVNAAAGAYPYGAAYRGSMDLPQPQNVMPATVPSVRIPAYARPSHDGGPTNYYSAPGLNFGTRRGAINHGF